MSRGGSGNILHSQHALAHHSQNNHNHNHHHGHRRALVGALLASGDLQSISLAGLMKVQPIRLNPLRPVALNRLGIFPTTLNRLGSGLAPTLLNNKKVYYSTGRGGAGNITTGEAPPLPKIVAQGENYPKLHTAYVSTGRGGWGNMVGNSDPELTRKLQDVDGKPELAVTPLNKSFLVGRGGFGNITTTKLRQSQNLNCMATQVSPEANLYTILSHGNELKKKRNKSFLGKLKDYFS